MNRQRKLQLGAAAVIANGLIALGAMTPTPAMAAACGDNNRVILCDWCASSCPLISGCTASKICIPACGMGVLSTACLYN